MAENLLFIDRDEKLTAAMSVYLARQQYRVTCANSWSTACNCLKEDFSGIVIIDPSLPDGDQNNIFGEIKSNCSRLPVVIAAAPHELEKAMEYFQGSARGYLAKPIKSTELDILLNHISENLALRREISRNTRKLEDLQYTRVLYQQLFDEVPCYISVQDRQFRITATNRMFKRDFGGETGGYCYNIYKHRSTPCPKCPVARTFEDGNHHQTEEVVTSRSGNQYNVLTWTAPIVDEKGEISQVMEMATNITQIRRLQDHLTSLGLMIGSMSHGIKGMLTALDGGVYQMETGFKKGDHQRVELGFERVRQTVDRIRKMVLEILFYAKSRGISYEIVSVEAFVHSVIESVKPALEKHGIGLNLEIAEDIGDFQVDPDWFQQSLVNFLENAVDACVADNEKDCHEIDFTVRAEEDQAVVFGISDDGIGMDDDTRQKIFTLFFSSKGSRGTGLGLFISHHIIRQHGGSINVSSAYGKGTTLEIRIPRHRPMQAEASESVG